MNRESKLAELRAQQDEYYCRGDLEIDGVPLTEKSIVTIIAATGVGKSTITKRILELAEEQGVSACEGGTDTTRPHRADDGATYRTDVPLDEMASRIDNQEYANWSVTPSGHIYATPIESLKGEHNFLPCLPESYKMLRRAEIKNRLSLKSGFATLQAFYLVTTCEAWDAQIESRKTLRDFPGRIEEAMESLEFGYKTNALQKLVSLPDTEGENTQVTKTAQTILDFARAGKRFDANQFTLHDQEREFKRRNSEMYRWAIILGQQYGQTA